jgi:hypothetical protein
VVERIPPIDPTKNVLDLVAAQEKLRDLLRVADLKYSDARADAETRRVNELAAQKLTFDLELAKILRANQDAAATLLATQLKEVKTDLSDRTSKLEQFRWEAGGKSLGAGALWTAAFGIIGLLIAFGTLMAMVVHGH